MGRLLELIVAGVILWLFLESWVARITGRGGRGGRAGGGGRGGRGLRMGWRIRRAAAPPPQPPPGPRPVADVTLVRCAGCGTHVPQSRALSSSSSRYCSERCLRDAERAG